MQHGVFNDLAGQTTKYNIKVINRAPNHGSATWWNCQCYCGKKFEAAALKLHRDLTKSCGCHRAKKDKPANSPLVAGQVIKWITLLKKHSSGEWLCECHCGGEFIAADKELDVGDVISCGCGKRKSVRNGTTNHPIGAVYKGMIARCTNPKDPSYFRYGGRGIQIDTKWLNDFSAFVKDMYPTYQKGLQLDRIDNDGKYEPTNCKWATLIEQANNMRTNRVVKYLGRSMTVSQWSSETGITEEAIRGRLDSGWSVKKTMTTPVRGKNVNSI